MEDLTPPVQTDEQPGAGPRVEAMPADPVLESLGARWHAEESTAATDILSGGEKLASMTDGSMSVPGATAEAAGSSGAEAGVADAALESKAEKPMVPEEQTTLPEVSEGVVGHAMQPPSPLVVPPATEEEDGVEETEHEES